jgi:hypothetical protein
MRLSRVAWRELKGDAGEDHVGVAGGAAGCGWAWADDGGGIVDAALVGAESGAVVLRRG